MKYTRERKNYQLSIEIIKSDRGPKAYQLVIGYQHNNYTQPCAGIIGTPVSRQNLSCIDTDERKRAFLEDLANVLEWMLKYQGMISHDDLRGGDVLNFQFTKMTRRWARQQFLKYVEDIIKKHRAMTFGPRTYRSSMSALEWFKKHPRYHASASTTAIATVSSPRPAKRQRTTGQFHGADTAVNTKKGSSGSPTTVAIGLTGDDAVALVANNNSPTPNNRHKTRPDSPESVVDLTGEASVESPSKNQLARTEAEAAKVIASLSVFLSSGSSRSAYKKSHVADSVAPVVGSESVTASRVVSR